MMNAKMNQTRRLNSRTLHRARRPRVLAEVKAKGKEYKTRQMKRVKTSQRTIFQSKYFFPITGFFPEQMFYHKFI